MEPLSERLHNAVLQADGAMGTLLFARGADVTSCVEVLNTENPAAVERVHLDYIAAGAQLLKTNSFAANRLKLAAHDLKGRLGELNAQAVALARRAAAHNAYVAGSIGPLGALMRPLGSVSRAEARDVFVEHAAAVATAGPDLLLLETFGSVEEALLALDAAREAAPGLPIIVSLSIMEDAKTPGGDPPLAAFRRLVGAGAFGVGINCALGPQGVFDALVPVIGHLECPVSVMPNAGYPRQVDNRTVYVTSPRYFADFARRFIDIGATVVGGCCGTTPEHVAAMAHELRAKRPQARPAPAPSAQAVPWVSLDDSAPAPAARKTETPSPGFAGRHTSFERKLGREFVITVELSPPRGVDFEPSVLAAKLIEAAGADAVSISENPTARLRMSSTALGHLIVRETGLGVILHLTCRDRNVLGLQSDLLGASALGIDAIVALTGDPTNVGDFPKATSVFDVTAAGLTEIVNAFNHGKDHAGNSIGQPTRFHLGVALNPIARDVDMEVARMQERMAAGADFAITQPVYDVAAALPFLQRADMLGFPVIVGVLPLQSVRNAEYLHNEVPGMAIPLEVRRRMEAASDAHREGIAIARDLLAELINTPGAAGAYLIAQERYESAAEVVSAARVSI
ncbi:MAG: bifunctional homocysteine S-methyltransferase/methylenetetrahydrofolate reductase [Candidatus Eremiobacteraeota bacterium]|nr:bifunctional homocysteine S-methyltransferase/methylenetetrahydrofolate reductase [Candidatus Eremiobacteraeota bacterium]